MKNQLPSQVYDDYWIRADAPDSTYWLDGNIPANLVHPDRRGKWLIMPLKENLDEVWAKIRAATESGGLGIAAKSSTMRPNSNSVNQKLGLICVYTHDSHDLQDVKRVLAVLRELGFNGRLNYKEDEETYSGNYSTNSTGAVSIFTSPPESLEIMHPKKWQGERLV